MRSRASRERIFKDAWLEFADGGRAPVVVRNISGVGARIEFSHASHLPERVSLLVPSLGVRRAARVVWQDARSAGLQLL